MKFLVFSTENCYNFLVVRISYLDSPKTWTRIGFSEYGSADRKYLYLPGADRNRLPSKDSQSLRCKKIILANSINRQELLKSLSVSTDTDRKRAKKTLLRELVACS
jgi:hypothetical protein